MKFNNSDAGRIQAGFVNENKDCAVRAAVVRFCTTYQRAHELLESVGRRNGRGVTLGQIKKLFEIMGLEYQKPIYRPTLKQFIDQHPTGRHFVCVRGHAIGINNGIIVDNAKPRLRKRVMLHA